MVRSRRFFVKVVVGLSGPELLVFCALLLRLLQFFLRPWRSKQSSRLRRTRKSWRLWRTGKAKVLSASK